ncbi:MAG TPA: ABC transporter ATP-binding protein [Bacilli bacterium]|nr:ABC transporter ATP-binding protein [Bacilli bacterium]HQO93745.1 ABC transporter ATP-binding protein [Bacilli bacterium]HQQ39308.1 ABC transporter ATP-binding protein [Bacilli bacterium]
MKSRKESLKLDYTSKEILARVFKYAWRNKFVLLLSVFLLISFTFLEMVQPLITKQIIDTELTGVQTTWVETMDSSKASYNGKFYEKTDQNTGNIYTIKYSKDLESYIFIEGSYKEYYIESLDQSTNTINLKKDDLSISSNYQVLGDDITKFYSLSKPLITRWIIIFGIISILILIFRLTQRVTYVSASMKLTLDLRKETFDKLNRLPIAYFSTEPSGKTVTKMIFDSEGVRGVYDVMFEIFSASISLIIVYVGLFVLDYRLALLTFLAFPIIWIWLTVYRSKVNHYNFMIRESNSILNGRLAEFVNSVGVIQIFNKEEKMSNEYNNMLIENTGYRNRRLVITTFFGNEMLMTIQRIIVAFVLLYFGLRYFDTRTLLIATTISVYIDYIGRLVQPISSVFANLNTLEDSLVSASRVFSFLDEKEDTGLGEITGKEFTGKIEFKNVSFYYEKENYVLKDVSLKINPGDFVGLVGHTGSGKSTMMSLLERYYDLEEGEILLDGENYLNYSKADIRENIGLILQDAVIFEGTIKENIAYGIEATDEEVINVLLAIGGDKFVYELKDGIHSKTSYQGENLSIGEKQIIAFARILLKNPKILILDEATANIDTETELLIQNALNVLTENRTTFVVAHRLSTIQNADHIIVLDEGRIVEEGKHQELMALKGKYRDMYEAQIRKQGGN